MSNEAEVYYPSFELCNKEERQIIRLMETCWKNTIQRKLSMKKNGKEYNRNCMRGFHFMLWQQRLFSVTYVESIFLNMIIPNEDLTLNLKYCDIMIWKWQFYILNDLEFNDTTYLLQIHVVFLCIIVLIRIEFISNC